MAERSHPTLAPVEPDSIPEISRAGVVSELIEEFLASGMEAAAVQEHSKTFNVSLSKYLKKNPQLGVESVSRGGKIYLRKVEPTEAPAEAEASGEAEMAEATA